MTDLNPYVRQMLLKEVGMEGQKKLGTTRMLVIGAGGLGAPVLQYLAASGIGTLGICDGDCVEWSNLNRQILHGFSDLGRHKVDSAMDALRHLRNDLELVPYYEPIAENNIESILQGWDLILDCTDRFEIRHFISDACRTRGIPHIEAGVHGWDGFVFPIWDTKGPCYRCLYPKAPKQVENPIPVMGALCGIVGSHMAMEAIGWALGIPKEPGRITMVEGLNSRMRSFKWPKANGCICNSNG